MDQTLQGTAAPAISLSEEDRIYRKVSWRLVPFLILCYVVAYLDRVNVGFAKLQMLQDLNLSDAVYGLGAGIFFIGYFIFEIPSNVILHRVGAKLWIARIMITWGLVSAAMMFTNSATTFYVLRFLLGAAEAGFFPGMILYLTYWFPSHRRANIVAMLLAGFPISGIFGGPISGYILHYFAGLHHLAGWQWLFLLEAIPAIFLGIVVYFLFEDSVAHARWLTSEEKAIVAADISAESSAKSHLTIRSVFLSPRVWLMGLIYFCVQMGSYAIGFWLPTMIRLTGVTDAFQIGLRTIVPYSLALIATIATGRHSDRTRERRWHIVRPCFVAAIGFILCTRGAQSPFLAMIGMNLAVAGVVTAVPMFWALPTSFLGGAAAAAGIAFVNCTGNLGGCFSPTLIGLLKTHTGNLNSGLLLIAQWPI